MKKLGLIGFPLGHSFSKKYYVQKMAEEAIEGIDYDLYPIENITHFPNLYSDSENGLSGCNVTIPYKQAVIPYLDELSEEAQFIGAVNCITIERKGDGSSFLKGYNTDAFGFEQSLLPLLDPALHTHALVLGNGGAAKAVLFVLKKLGIPTQLVSRKASVDAIAYEEITPEIIAKHQLIVNCTPLGTFPNVDACPPIPYSAITAAHYLYDLIYNPEETLFLQKGREQGAATKNGYDMLVLQADKNWAIWLAENNSYF